MMAMMQKMMNITTAITPEEDKKRKQKVKTKISVTSEILYQCTTASGYHRAVYLYNLYTIICLYHILDSIFISILSPELRLKSASINVIDPLMSVKFCFLLEVKLGQHVCF